MRGYGAISVNKHGWIEKDLMKMGANDAIIKPIAVAPCTSDVHFMKGGSGVVDNRIMGHEAVGEVVEVGSEVKRFKVGDRVIVPCNTPDWGALGTQIRGANNAHDHGMMKSFKFLSSKDGVFAEYFHVNMADGNLVILEDDIPIDSALMTVDMMSTGFYAAEMADIQFGETVVVMGIGPLGLMSVAGAQLKGAGRIIGVGTRPNCIEIAKKYGANDIVSYKEGDVVEQIMEINKGQVDKVIIAGGNAETFSQAVSLTKENGTISNINFFDVTDNLQMPAYTWGLGMADKTIKGGFCPGGARRIEYLTNIIRHKRVDPSLMITHEFHGFDKIEDAFIVMEEKPRDLIKPIVYID